MVQVNTEKLTIRFKFRKEGSLQYISHLDLVRTMNKIIVRAKLPLWYTEGFNPKPKMVFAAPLSIGTESHAEYMDIRLTEYIDPAEAMARMNANMTSEMQVIEAYYPTAKLTELAWLSYTVKVNSPHLTERTAEECNAVLSADEMPVLKSTKSGEKIVDIRHLVKEAAASYADGTLTVTATLSASPSEFLNPEYLIKLLRERVGILSDPDLTRETYSIMRERAFAGDMSEFR
jgi:radical SAM-linked protein